MDSGRRTGASHACEESVRAARRFLRAAAALALREDSPGGPSSPGASPAPPARLPEAMPPLAESLEHFVATAVRLRRVGRDSGRTLKTHVDHALRPRFCTSLYVEDATRWTLDGRIVRVAVSAYLAPPALPAEVSERAAFLAAGGMGIPLDGRAGPGRSGLFARLTRREGRRLRFIPLDEQVALGAVLAAPGRTVAAFSEDGRWPENPLVLDVARRLSCRIARFVLGVFPARVVRHLRLVRYHAVPAAAYGEPGG